MTDYILYLLLLVSLLINIFLIYRIKSVKSKPRPESLELQEFIHDLTQGSGLIRIQRVDSSSLFLRSPRG